MAEHLVGASKGLKEAPNTYYLKLLFSKNELSRCPRSPCRDLTLGASKKVSIFIQTFILDYTAQTTQRIAFKFRVKIALGKADLN